MKTLEEMVKEWLRTNTEKRGDVFTDEEWQDKEMQEELIKPVMELLGTVTAHVWEEAIAAQKLICAEAAEVTSKQHPDWDGWGIMPIISEVDKDSILNAPDAVNPFKK